jgi:predicted transcriptional regulator
MQILTEKKPRAYNMTIKLAASDRDRLRSCAVAKKRTPHYLMKEAITAYLEREEVEQRFMEAAREAR